MSGTAQAEVGASDRRIDLLVRAVGLFGLALVGVTWRLWTPQDVFPQAPLVGGLRSAPAWLDWAALSLMLASLATWMAAGAGKLGRVAAVAWMAGAAVACLLDQHRLQPWLYQFALFALALVASPRGAATLMRLIVVGVYLHSALGKFDYEFLATTGQHFLGGLANVLGASVDKWPRDTRLAGALLFPLGELAVGVGLWAPWTRRWAVIGAVGLHLALLAALGPWGLDHRPGVLIWNVFFLVQAVLLFWPAAAESNAGESRSPASAPAPWAVIALAVPALLLPLASRGGYWDHWPAWGLYSPSHARAVVLVSRGAADKLPPDLQPYLEPHGDDPLWQRVAISRWSLDALGAPIYPQDRFHIAVALALAERHQLRRSVRVIWEQPPDRRTGRRRSTLRTGTDQLRQTAQTFRLNALPRMRR